MRRLIRGQWTERKARTATLKVLAEIKDRYLEIGSIWGGEDETPVSFADDQIDAVDKFTKDISDYWTERDQERAAGETA